MYYKNDDRKFGRKCETFPTFFSSGYLNKYIYPWKIRSISLIWCDVDWARLTILHQFIFLIEMDVEMLFDPKKKNDMKHVSLEHTNKKKLSILMIIIITIKIKQIPRELFFSTLFFQVKLTAQSAYLSKMSLSATAKIMFQHTYF